MRVLFLGDLVGRSGRSAVIKALPGLRERYRLDFVVVNGENAAGGFGITETILVELLDAGADVVTTGKGAGLFKAANGAQVLVINAMGRVFMADLDDPFRAAEKELEACGLKT